ncbi:conserved hypothetical protein [Burkholderia cenocepacia]|uniref:hypothetical protein n=1 Tax=Burkholderia cenocepacia TaxID=95486 RepID=UPI00192B0656|nr:hypothetical protein [Burkholderia cenocepacia]CAD9228029.1 conserved hypothetical protein [Burkholderia cenocepacia]
MFDMNEENYKWHKSTIDQFSWTPEIKIGNEFASMVEEQLNKIIVTPANEYSLEALKDEINDNMILEHDKPRDFYNFSIINSVYDQNYGSDFAVNDLSKLFHDKATINEQEVKEVLKQTEQHMLRAHTEELLNATDEKYPVLARQHKLEREIYEMNLAKAEKREPNLDKLQDAYFAYKTNFDIHTEVSKQVTNLIEGINNKLDGLNKWVPSSGYVTPEIKVEVKSQENEPSSLLKQETHQEAQKTEIPATETSWKDELASRIKEKAKEVRKEPKVSEGMQAWLERDGYSDKQKEIISRVETQNQNDKQAAKEAAEAEAQKQILLEEYRQAKYPTKQEAVERIHDNIDDAKGPRNFLDQTQGMWVNVSPVSRVRDIETGETHQLKTTGEIIERNKEHGKDIIAGQNIDAAVSIAVQELKLTQQKEISGFNGDFEALALQEAKHKVEQTYFNVRHTELVDEKIPFQEERQFHAAYTRFSQLENAETIKSIEAMYPAETKALQVEHGEAVAQVEVPERVQISMKPNRDGYTPLGDVKSRLEAYEARRQEKLAAIEQAPAQESIQSILAAQKAQEAPQTAQEVSQPTQAVETAQNAPKADPNHLRGTVIDYGSAPYLHNAENNQSFYVTVMENGKERTKWGIDIGPALDKAEVQVGDFIDLQKTETVPAQATTKQGEKVSTHRNSWEAQVVEHKQVEKEEPTMFEYNGDTYWSNENERATQQAPKQSFSDIVKGLGQQEKARQEQAQAQTQQSQIKDKEQTMSSISSMRQETEEQKRIRMLAEIEANKPISAYVNEFERMKRMAAGQSQGQAKSRILSNV